MEGASGRRLRLPGHAAAAPTDRTASGLKSLPRRRRTKPASAFVGGPSGPTLSAPRRRSYKANRSNGVGAEAPPTTAADETLQRFRVRAFGPDPFGSEATKLQGEPIERRRG
ncbi:DUF6053 domain-containing protein [Lysobacter enzymogenes]|uniref:DUF6053 domain-containing protein n=1 Tax=Lysobacter enzymogenes TaxID=69 RepID=UPI003D18EF3D